MQTTEALVLEQVISTPLDLDGMPGHIGMLSFPIVLGVGHGLMNYCPMGVFQLRLPKSAFIVTCQNLGALGFLVALEACFAMTRKVVVGCGIGDLSCNISVILVVLSGDKHGVEATGPTTVVCVRIPRERTYTNTLLKILFNGLFIG